MNFEQFFRLISYATVFCGFLALLVSGSFGLIGTGLFVVIMIGAWFLEGTRWQISERLGTAMIVLALPAYYFASRYQLISLGGTGIAIAGVLGRLIITLTAIKLLQRKSDRDWVFLYLMAFFEVLLAAGLSISALYVATFVLYLLLMICAIIAFEIRKTSRSVSVRSKPVSSGEAAPLGNSLPARRLPAVAVALIVFIILLGLPLFFFLPRVGGAGFGGSTSGVSTRTGFSDTVRLGRIGEIQQNDEIVMRIRLEGDPRFQSGLYWRGLALDTFDGTSWRRSNPGAKEFFPRDSRDLIQVDFATGRDDLTIQTVYLEPLDTNVLFGLPRIVALQTALPAVFKDGDDGLSSSRLSERISYRVLSDRGSPQPESLRSDSQRYTSAVGRYLVVPDDLDERVAQLAEQVTAGQANRYDRAAAIENFLQNEYGYTLELKAGGRDPLADFLFNVREGHCEYFATAMAIMLRTQGIATRVVNGFHQGDYNETADMYVVRQRNAHSWVEVYFPRSDSWVRFDPTPPAGQTPPPPTGLMGRVGKYFEAIEAVWIQYFVAYDSQGQRSLARSVRSGLADYQQNISSFLGNTQAVLREWWSEARGDKGSTASFSAIGYALAWIIGFAAGAVLFVWIGRKIVKLQVWRLLAERFYRRRAATVIEFYDRMQRILASKGLVRQPHQTPLEFAHAVGMHGAIRVTERYNRVRFGEKDLTRIESDQIDQWLRELETTDPHR